MESKANAPVWRMLVGLLFAFLPVKSLRVIVSSPSLSRSQLGLRGRKISICGVASPPDWPVHPSPCLNVSSLFRFSLVNVGLIEGLLFLLYENCAAFCSC